MNTATQFDLEVDGVAFSGGDGLELLREARFIAHRQPGTQGADEFAQAGNGDEIESLAPRHAPVVHATEQQRTPQCARLIVFTRCRPLCEFVLQLSHATVTDLIGLAHTEAKHARERILCQMSRLALAMAVSMDSQGIGGKYGLGRGHGGTIMVNGRSLCTAAEDEAMRFSCA